MGKPPPQKDRAPSIAVEAEEDVFSFTPANNGATPFTWVVKGRLQRFQDRAGAIRCPTRVCAYTDEPLTRGRAHGTV